jgi:hypothetical protein
MYGNIGEDDVKAIDAHIGSLTGGAVIVDLGCGPYFGAHVERFHNLARTVRRCSGYETTLVLADLYDKHLNFWDPCLRNVQTVQLNAATATSVLGRERADLVLAFGLFGALGIGTTPEGGGKVAWPAVLAECFQMLKRSGRLIVSNSCVRQPVDEFRAAVEKAGFAVPYYHQSPSRIAASELRYLMVCEKPKRRKRRVTSRRNPPQPRLEPRPST